MAYKPTSILDIITKDSCLYEVLKEPKIKHLPFKGFSYIKKPLNKSNIIKYKKGES
jgi:hypothetical protein